jgi:hypothetical protein
MAKVTSKYQVQENRGNVYAEYYGLSEILTEDFQHDRLYGTVCVVNPFIGIGLP